MIRIGTRASKLAVTQTGLVADWLQLERAVRCELITISSAGDRGENQLDKSRWVSDLEQALLAGEVDLAVHSAKDVPDKLAPGLTLLATYEPRADARDALCGAASLDDLPKGAVVGTSSLRRHSQLLAERPDLTIKEIRGNIDTRLARLESGDYDAIVLASAGLDRIGQSGQIGCRLSIDTFIPAAGQGTLVVEGVRSDLSNKLFPQGPSPELLAERSFVTTIGADCHSPVGAHARYVESGELELSAYVGLADGTRWITDRVVGRDPHALGQALASRMTSLGGDEILETSRNR